MSSAKKYIVNDVVTDEATLIPALVSQCSISTTVAQLLPKTLGMKDSATFDYYSKQVKITYPDGTSRTTAVIPGVVFHYETFDHYGKTGVYVGIPQTFVAALNRKMAEIRTRCIFEETALASDSKWWWIHCGFSTAEADNEYIYIIEDEGGEILETPFANFSELFNYIGSSVIATVTCTIKMSTKISVDKKGALSLLKMSGEWA